MNRRDFLKAAGIQAGALAAGAGPARGMLSRGAEEANEKRRAPAIRQGRPEVAVIGAGAFGVWTAYHLRQRGVDVLLIDQYGPGNSRATSGGETRGVRTGYRDNELWTRWASRAVERWNEFNERWIEECGVQLYFPTGDLTLREDWERFTTQTRESWDEVGVKYEVLSPDEVKYRWPQIDVEGVGVALYEREAGVVRARKVCEQVAGMYTEHLEGALKIGRVELGEVFDGRLADIVIQPGGERISADQFIFALGPWFGKMFPEVMGPRMRIFMGHVYYYGVAAGDNRFRYPNMPSYNVPGVTGWVALPPDSRGFRVRTGGRSPEGENADPDTSVRYIPPEFLDRPRSVLEDWFPDLVDAPLVETRACHYEGTPDREWLVDHHPEMRNVWLFGGGNGEGFKFGPVLGQYMAQRALGEDPYPEYASRFRLSEETFG